MVERMPLRVDRDAEMLERERVLSRPSLVFTQDSTVVTLRTASASHQLDGSTFALVPARTAYALELPRRGSSAVLTLEISDVVSADATKDYAPYVEPRQLRDVLGTLRWLARTRWIDELAHRYVFERTICERAASHAARFLEAELVKEVYFLGLEQIENRTRASVLYEGETVAIKARAWIEQHLFEPFHGAALARHCCASESTVLRAFRKELGVSPFGYVRRRRLEEALALLESGRYGVTEVAARVGYENPSAFAVAFRQQFGTAPSSKRRVHDPAATLPAHGRPPVRRPRRRD
jgi:AraC-like DNA-binding protein